jgi:hypothetical protein
MKVRMMARKRMTLTEALLNDLSKWVKELKQNGEWFVYEERKV